MKPTFPFQNLAWFILSATALLLMSNCAYIRHTQKTYEGEVFLTPPPPDVQKDLLVPFRVTDSYIRFLETLTFYSYTFDKSMTAVNPMRFPVYNLEMSETFEWWEWFLVLADLASDLGGPDSRTIVLKGRILVPEDQKNWQPQPQSPLFGPTVFKTTR